MTREDGTIMATGEVESGPATVRATGDGTYMIHVASTGSDWTEGVQEALDGLRAAVLQIRRSASEARRAG